MTIRNAIEKQRLGKAMKLLFRKGHTVAMASEKCGYKSPNRLTRAFKRHFGVSIREWLEGKAQLD